MIMKGRIPISKTKVLGLFNLPMRRVDNIWFQLLKEWQGVTLL